jgi:hypothetical protein
MDLISIEFRSSDRETADLMTDLVEELRGQEPDGTKLILPSSDELKAADPLVITFAIAFVSGLVGGAGKALGESAMRWLIAKVRERLSPNKTTTAKAQGQQINITLTTPLEQEKTFSKAVVQQVTKELK